MSDLENLEGYGKTATAPPPASRCRSVIGYGSGAVSRWIELNREAIIDHWDGKLSLTELLARLQQLA